MENIHNTATHFDDNSQPALEKATLGFRIGAFLVDQIILTIVLMRLLFGGIETELSRVFEIFPIFMFVGFVVYGLKDIVKGQSFGKYMFGMAVRDSTYVSEVSSAGRLFLRNIFTFIWPVELIILACSPSRTKLGDRLAHTNVYRISGVPKLARVIISIFLVIVIFVGSIMLILRNHPAYHMALGYIETNPRIIELVGDVEGFGFFPNGSVSITNGYGLADFTIRVNGSDGTIHIRIILVREPLGDWEVVSFYYRQ